jgi:hypothetical protein
MADIPSKYKLDLNRITAREYYSLFDTATPVEVEREIVSRAWGISVDEYLDLPQGVHQMMNVEFFRRAKNPVEESSGEKN